jgi:hypothetical protein
MDDVELVVLGHFDNYVRGDVITDKAKIEEILSGPHQHDVVKRVAATQKI